MAAKPDVESALGAGEVARILGVHPRTIERRRARRRRSGALERQRADKLDRVWAALLEIYTPENARCWLESRVPALEDRRPLDIMAEDGGLDRVLDAVGRMNWGIPN